MLPSRAAALLCLVSIPWGPRCVCQGEPESPRPQTAELRQLTDWPGSEDSPRFSPDGERLAFDAQVEGQSDIFVLRLADGHVTRLTDSPAVDRRPAWSPDGRRIAFQSLREGRYGIWSVPSGGGRAEPLFVQAGISAISPDYAQDGTLAFTGVEPDPTLTHGKVTPWILSPGEGQARSIGVSDSMWHGRWGPAGEWLYYYVGVGDEIRRVDRRGAERSVSRGSYVGWHPSVSADGSHLAFVSSSRWTLWLQHLDASGQPLRAAEARDCGSPTFSPSGGAIAFSSDSSASQIAGIDLEDFEISILCEGRFVQPTRTGGIVYLTDRGGLPKLAMREVGGREVLLPHGDPDLRGFDVSPGGDRIVLVTGGGGPSGEAALIVAGMDGSHPKVLLEDPHLESPRWLDEETILFDWYGETQFRRIMALDIDGGRVRAMPGEFARQQVISTSGSGEWITAARIHGATGSAVFRADGDTWRVERHPDATDATLSPDGQRMAYVADSEGQSELFLQETDGEVLRLTEGLGSIARPRFSLDGKRIYFEMRTPSRDLWLADLSTRSR